MIEDPWHFPHIPARARYHKEGVGGRKDSGAARI